MERRNTFSSAARAFGASKLYIQSCDESNLWQCVLVHDDHHTCTRHCRSSVYLVKQHSDDRPIIILKMLKLGLKWHSSGTSSKSRDYGLWIYRKCNSLLCGHNHEVIQAFTGHCGTHSSFDQIQLSACAFTSC